MAVLTLMAGSSVLLGASSDAQIRAARLASNAAIKSGDEHTNMSFLTEDVLITTGAGNLLSGKRALKDYIHQANNSSPMYFVRTTEELVVNEARGLAWEQGFWKGYMADDQDEENVIYYGKYAAQWIRASGKWLISSQLFVSLDD